MELWLQTPPGHALDPDFLRAVYLLTQHLESNPGITAVDGPTTVLTWAALHRSPGRTSYPHSPTAWQKLAEDLEQIVLTQPGARAYIDVADLASVRLSIRGRGEYFGRHGSMENYLRKTWAQTQKTDPAFHSTPRQPRRQGSRVR